MIRILSVDDHPIMHEGISALINNEPDMAIVAEASAGRDAYERFREALPDITLMDLKLPDMSGIEAMRSILAEFPSAKVVMLTMMEGDEAIRKALEAGARGYLLKTTRPEEILSAIRRVHKGKRQIPVEVAAHLAQFIGNETLTAREIEVLQLIKEGNKNRGIADLLFISEETVKVHVRHIMDKLDASDRTQAVTIAVRRGIIQI